MKSLGKKFKYVFIAVIFILLILPLFTTFNEFLTKAVLQSGIWQRIQNFWAPYQVRFVGGFLKIFGIKNESLGSTLMIRKNNILIPFYLSWNCIGWQSMILIVISLITGLQGNYSFSSKVETIIIGLLGTFIVNIIRIAGIALFIYYWGKGPAVFFHNYGGTILTISWIVFFWWLVFSFVLRPEKNSSDENEV